MALQDEMYQEYYEYFKLATEAHESKDATIQSLRAEN
jgi:hypothetical protein